MRTSLRSLPVASLRSLPVASLRSLPVASLLALACSSGLQSGDDDGTGGTDAGAGGSGGAIASGGATGPSGGQNSGGALASGGSSAGGSSAGGSESSGGASIGGSESTGGADSSGGADGVGGGEPNGSGGSDGGDEKAPPKPSAGCNKANPAVGSSGSPLTVSGHQYYVKLPTNYDPSKPYPVLIMFNPTGNPISWAEQSAGYERNEAKDKAIRVYPHPANSSSGWGAGDVSFFAPFHQKIIGDYCVDENRVFAAGESSGGDFASILGCEHADKVRAIAPCATKNVPQYQLNPSTRNCTGQVTAIVIHGKDDKVVGTENGPKTRDFYTALNSCGSNATPVQGYTDTQSNCVMYEGCDDGYPVYWCHHTDPEYSGTNHGWPKFAANMTWKVFSEY